MELPLPLLSEAAVAAYLTRRFADAGLPAGLVRLVHQRTEGNPLFMVTVVEDWVRRGWLVQADAGWTLQVELAALASTVPDGLRQMMEQQLERLSPMEQRVLEVGAPLHLLGRSRGGGPGARGGRSRGLVRWAGPATTVAGGVWRASLA